MFDSEITAQMMVVTGESLTPFARREAIDFECNPIQSNPIQSNGLEVYFGSTISSNSYGTKTIQIARCD
jgi:hypothetical protein